MKGTDDADICFVHFCIIFTISQYFAVILTEVKHKDPLTVF